MHITVTVILTYEIITLIDNIKIFSWQGFILCMHQWKWNEHSSKSIYLFIRLQNFVILQGDFHEFRKVVSHEINLLIPSDFEMSFLPITLSRICAVGGHWASSKGKHLPSVIDVAMPDNSKLPNNRPWTIIQLHRE